MKDKIGPEVTDEIMIKKRKAKKYTYEVVTGENVVVPDLNFQFGRCFLHCFIQTPKMFLDEWKKSLIEVSKRQFSADKSKLMRVLFLFGRCLEQFSIACRR